MVVKNEDRFIWYAISSVLKYVDTFLIADTGSTDDTVKIINSFSNKRIKFSKHNIKTPLDISKIRQNQIEATYTDWFWVVDGDEIYSDTLISEILNVINQEKNHFEGIVVGRYDLLGDIYHYQDNTAGYYQMLGEKGHFALRLINKKKIPSLHIEGEYPLEGYYDNHDSEITTHNPDKFYFTKGSLYHAMYLRRSSVSAKINVTFNRNKFKIEKGKNIPREFIPEVFLNKNQADSNDIIAKRSNFYEIAASIITPIKKFKRRFS